MKVIECVQGSDIWWEQKCGVPSASNFARIITPIGKQCDLPTGHEGECRTGETKKPKGAERCQVRLPQLSEAADGYIAELLAERICQLPKFFSGRGIPKPILDGIDREPESRAWFALTHGVSVEQVGFILTDCGRFGCSPDGIMPGLKRGLELKNPTLATHLQWLMDRDDDGVVRLPDEHKVQVHGGLCVTGYDAWHFVSYVPDDVEKIDLLIYPNEFTRALRKALDDFWPRYNAACLNILGVPALITKEAI